MKTALLSAYLLLIFFFVYQGVPEAGITVATPGLAFIAVKLWSKLERN